MKIQNLRKKALSAVLTGMLGVLSIAHADMDDANKRWQNNILFNPSQHQLQREQAGIVMIYDGLTDKTVDNVMDNQFDRLNSMMFTRVIVTDNSGDAVINPNTGDVEVENDGCD